MAADCQHLLASVGYSQHSSAAPIRSNVVPAGGSGLSGGAIAGVAVGSAAVVVALIVLMACCLLGGRRRREQPPSDVEMLGSKVSEEKVRVGPYAVPSYARPNM